MNRLKAWNTKLEVASFFLLSKILYKKCALCIMRIVHFMYEINKFGRFKAQLFKKYR